MYKDTIYQEGDNIYVNISINSNNEIKDTLAEYSTTKTLPILTKCSDYYCSVIRFQIPLSNVPLFIMPIVDQDPFIGDKTPFELGMSYLGDFVMVNVYYTPTIINEPPPAIYNPENPYYYVYDYQVIINMLNITLCQLYSSLNLNINFPNNVPYFYFDSSDSLIKLVVDTINFSPYPTVSSPTPVPEAYIYMNTDLQSFLNAFPVFYDKNLNIYRFDLIKFGYQNSIPPFTPTSEFRVFTQEYPTVQNFSSLKKIIISSNTIPIMGEYTPSKINSSVSSTFQILSDFIPNIENVGDNKDIAYYNPTSQYRLLDLKSDQSLYNLNIKIYWQDENFNIYPLYIHKYNAISIKIGFFKKSLYKYNNLLTK